jgi:hypothetical protein
MPSRILSHPAWPSVAAVGAYAIAADVASRWPCHEAGRALVAAAVAVVVANLLGTAALARRRHPRPLRWLTVTALAGVLSGGAVWVLWLAASFSACFVF